jgi:hypothetical protein
VLVVALLAAGCGGGTRLGTKAFAKQAESVQSLAAEGALLAQDAGAGRSTGIYVRVHSSYLHKAASQLTAQLKKAKTEPALEPKLRRLVSLAAEITARLDRLGDASRADQRALGRKLEAAAKESEQIGKGLS